jgi:4-amino-4-deoxy-L-arabinose transferase-like glycosyltransferase
MATRGSTSVRDWLWLLALLAVLYLWGLGQLPLVGYSEGRYAAIAAEMWHSGDWVHPRYSGLLHLEKPPLTYWAAAATCTGLGLTEYAVRLPAGLAAIGVVLLTVALGRPRGLRAGPVLATIPLFLVMGRVLMTDMLLALGSTLYVLGAVSGARARGWRAWAYALAAGVGLGIAVLSKLHLVLILATLPLVLEAACARRGRLALYALHPLSWSVAVAMLVPWGLAILREHPGILEWVLTYQTRDRLLTEVHDRTGPPWFYLVLLLPGLLPWTIPLLVAIRRTPPASEPAPLVTRRFLWLWLLVPLVILSCAGSKRFNYLPPILPPVALLAVSVLGGRRWPWWYATAVAALLAVGLLVAQPHAHRLVTWREVGATVRPYLERGTPVITYHLETSSLTFYTGGRPVLVAGVPRPVFFEDDAVLATRYFPDDTQAEQARLDALLAELPEALFVCKRGDVLAHLRGRVPRPLEVLHEGKRFVVTRLPVVEQEQ